MLNIEIYNCDQPDCPSEFDGWQLYSFNVNHSSFKHPSEFDFKHNIGLRRKLKVGTAFFLSYYEHGDCIWRLQDIVKPTPYTAWDTTYYGGILIWEEPIKNLGAKTLEDRQKDASAFLDIYTNWANGAVYSYFINDEDEKEIAHGTGFYTEKSLFEDISFNLPEGTKFEDVEFTGEAGWLHQYFNLKLAAA